MLSPLAPDSNSVRPHIVACIRQLLPEDVPSLDDVLDPIQDLGLESLDGVNFVVRLSKNLGFDFPADFNPFYGDDGRSRNIGRIVESVYRKMQSASEMVQTEKAKR